MQIEEIKEKIVPIFKKNKIKKAGVFGSIVKNQFDQQSDIDILIEATPDMSLLDFIGIKLELEDILGYKVDLVEYSAIKPSLRDHILKEEIRVV